MVATPGFDPSSTTARYNKSKPIRGADRLIANFHRETKKNLIGMTLDDGKAEAFSKVKQGLKRDSISKKVDGWEQVHADDVSNHTTLAQAYKDTFAAWEGDDADTAQKTFGHLVKSAELMPTYTKNVHSATTSVLAAVDEALGTGSSGPGHLGPVYNPFGGDGDGGKDEAEWQTLCQKISGNWNTMNQTVQWQAKTAAGSDPQGGYQAPGTNGAGVGGVSTPSNSATPDHLSTTPNSISKPKDLTDPSNFNDPDKNLDPDPIDDPEKYSPPTADPWDPSSGGGSGGVDGGAPSLDTGSSLAGLDPGGAGGFGSGGGGVDANGGALGAGAGSGGLAGAGDLSGVGAGGAGAGAGGAAGAGAGKAGASGMMAPMRGGAGGGSGNDEERERNTWLTEDEDVWGEDDAPPAVIS